ncbi:hypothetical protein [Sphingomonas bacterium]|uniref:hypothetical protein n=1 Tax=Sphingomonas bacterium TaxID=1895847 RepID=UPI00262A3B9F|nr:hypothetical protein [Sphingomonas bacterium]MDB5680097.1 hypothetical protein [Sphingomonas bacterium]
MSRHDDLPPPPPRDLLTFTPVPQTRHITGGWSAEVQRAFVAALARCAVVAMAARSVGMTPRSAYQLRRRAGEHSGFAYAWDRAIEHGATAAHARVLDRLADPDQIPIMWRGTVVGWRKKNDDRLLLGALRVLWAERRNMVPAHRERIARAEIYRQQCAEAEARLGPVVWPDPVEPAARKSRRRT